MHMQGVASLSKRTVFVCGHPRLSTSLRRALEKGKKKAKAQKPYQYKSHALALPFLPLAQHNLLNHYKKFIPPCLSLYFTHIQDV
ncbi:hypothetical protein HanIR_Chr09g0423701 [Helianthus annuus]|nr:hypothetical protein HanIR_Chr09g0423701 [Helianthus annuus]